MTTPIIKNKKYPLDSAGLLMVRDVPTVLDSASVGEIEKLLIKKTDQFSTINYIYILNESGHLLGAVSIKELFRSPKASQVKDLLPVKLISVSARTDKERVAMLALKYSLKAVPVVDKDKIFLGVVPSDVILKILHDEATEDIMRLSGVTKETPYAEGDSSLPLFQTLKHRLPWLVAGLAGGMLAADIVGRFEGILAEHIILAAFIPLIVYMSGAVCAQMQAFIIRDLAFNPGLKFLKYLLKQSSVTVVMGLAVSSLLYIGSYYLYGQAMVSFVLSVALFFAVLSSLLTGIIVPIMFSRLRLDPADASGPIGTIIQDVVSILVYLSVAVWIL